jgi:hypothetical protein
MTRQSVKKGMLALVVSAAAVLCLVLRSFDSVNADSPTPTPGRALLQLEADIPKENPSGMGQGTPPLRREAIQALNTITLDPIADTMVAQGQPNTNFWLEAGNLAIKVGYEDRVSEGQGIVRGLVRFNLSSIPVGSTVNSATLRLHYTYWRDYSGYYRRVTAYRVTDPWMEDTVTWNSRPGYGEAYGFVDLVAGGQSDFHYYDWDVTSLVQAWVNRTYNNHGIMLRGDEALGIRAFGSWETPGDEGEPPHPYTPQLVVNFDPPPPTLSASPNLLQFSAEDAGPNPQAKTIVVSNIGTDSLTWNATVLTGASWLSLNNTNGTVALLSPHSTSVSVDKSGLQHGVYEGQIRISSSTPGVQGSPQLVDVTFAYAAEETSLQLYLPIVLRNFDPNLPPSPSAPSRRLVAVVVGVADYEHMEPALGARAGSPGIDPWYTGFDGGKFVYTLENIGCSSGACALASMSSSANGNILLLTDSQATKAAIRDAITKWLDVWEDEDTLVVFFFSGHGMYAPDDDGDEDDPYDEFIAPYDLDCDPCYPEVENPVWLPETAIRDDELDSWLDELESNQIVIAINSCFSGGMVESMAGTAETLSLGTRSGDGLGPLEVGDGFALDVSKPGRVVLMASREDQESWEFGALKDGVFTYFLIQALWSSSADLNGDGFVSVEEAFQYLVNRVDDCVFPETGYHQNPQMYDGVAGEVSLTCP